MKRLLLSYKIIGLLFALMLSCATMTGAEYRGDQSVSPFMRFLRGLFWGGSGTATHFDHRPQGQTYQFSSLAIGSSKIGASASAVSSLQDGFPSGNDLNTSIISRKTGSSTRTKSFGNQRNTNVAVNVTRAIDYVSPLSTAAATTSAISNTSSSFASSSEVASVAMPSMVTVQKASSSQLTLATTSVNSSSGNNNNNNQGDDNGFGSNGHGAADPVIPTPVGDGSWVLFFLTALYVFRKRRRFFVHLF